MTVALGTYGPSYGGPQTVRKWTAQDSWCACRQANLVKQLAKLVKVRYVEDITRGERVGAPISLLRTALEQAPRMAEAIVVRAGPKMQLSKSELAQEPYTARSSVLKKLGECRVLLWT